MKKLINYISTVAIVCASLVFASSIIGICTMGFMFLFQNIGVELNAALKVILVISALIGLVTLKEEKDHAA